jgi:hypothetical protein
MRRLHFFFFFLLLLFFAFIVPAFLYHEATLHAT